MWDFPVWLIFTPSSIIYYPEIMQLEYIHNKTVFLFWIPGRVGMVGNGLIDKSLVQTTRLPPQLLPAFCKDYYAVVL